MLADVQHLRLAHPELYFRVDISSREFDARWLAVAHLADRPDIGTGMELREALGGALLSLGPRLTDELAADADLGDHWRVKP